MDFRRPRADQHGRRDQAYSVIICDHKGQETDRSGACAGGKDYVTKPVDAAELLSKIAALN